jgi:hypothetical protein
MQRFRHRFATIWGHPDDRKNGRVTRQIKNDFRVKARKISNLQCRERTFTIVRKQSKSKRRTAETNRGKLAAKISQLETRK